jgi:hypothetical protein
MIVYFSIFENNSSRLLSSFNPISSSILIHFEWFKTRWVHQLGIYKTFVYSKGKDATIKDFKLEILIFFNLPIIKH